MLCGGNADPTVFWVNTQLTQAFFQGKGFLQRHCLCWTLILR
jgi:hypothetical protein